MTWKQIDIPCEIHAILKRLDALKMRLDSHRPIPEYLIKNIKENLALEWTYNSNSIEGNTLTLLETRVVVEDGLTIGGKSLREHFEAVNHQEAIGFVEMLATNRYTLKIHDIVQAHALVLDKIDRVIAGVYRTAGVRISGANFTPPEAVLVPELMQELLDWVNTEALGVHPVIKAAVFHHRFVHIHPFFDGNGRTTRLLYNLILMSAGFPPAIILKVDRKKYYAALNAANTGDYTKLFLVVAQAAERSLTLYVHSLEDKAGGFKPISDIVQEPDVAYSQEYVSLLARQGKIEAYKEGRVWYTKKSAIAAYKKTRQRDRG